jgi:hypothetical protein
MPEIIYNTQIIPPQWLDLNNADQQILRELAGQVAVLAKLPVEIEKRQLWKEHNSLQPTRPVIFCDPEVGWGEIVRQDALRCQNPLARQVEDFLRRIVFWGTEMRDDRPIDPYLALPLFAENAFWGLQEIKHGGENGGSYVWESPVKSEADLQKLHFPQIKVDFEAQREFVERLNAIFGDLLPVYAKYYWWWSLGMTETLAHLRGLEQIMYDMSDRPELIHSLMSLLRDGTLAMLDELEAKGLLSPNYDTTYVGSGGFGLVDELPQADFSGRVRTRDLWGFAESQETVGISPRMFEEFIFPYQLPILERFGLNCYGCCEPLDKRWHVVKQFPRLRRISVSPWANRATMAKFLEDRYVFSFKPKPADLAMEYFDEERVRAELREDLTITRGCRVEVIMKDVTTVRNDPQRAVRWVQIAREEAERL